MIRLIRSDQECPAARVSFLVCLAVMWLLVSIAPAQDWPSLRGPDYDGSASAGDKELAAGPLQLDIVWNRPLGSGYSGVVKSGQRLVSAMADAELETEFLIAMDVGTGATLWQTPTGKMMKGVNGSFDGPVATPAVDDASRVPRVTVWRRDGVLVSRRDGSVDAKPESRFFGGAERLWFWWLAHCS